MWNRSPPVISESAQLLARRLFLPLWPEAFWLDSISESTSKKLASECAGLHRARNTVQTAFLISHVCCIVHENNRRELVIQCILPESFYSAFPASKHVPPLQVTIKRMQRESGRWCSLPVSSPSILFCHNFPCWVSKPWELLRALLLSALMDIYCAWATLCRQDLASLNIVLGKSSL